jgi:SsrA-binding protein
MPDNIKIIAKNKKAWHDFFILEAVETGIVLQGTEVKSIRAGNVNLKESYARVDRGEMFLHGMHIGTYEQGNRQNHEPRRPRKLLLHKRETLRLMSKVNERGLTLTPLSIYFKHGIAKIELALVKAKQNHDKRAALAEREDQREVSRALKEANRYDD